MHVVIRENTWLPINRRYSSKQYKVAATTISKNSGSFAILCNKVNICSKPYTIPSLGAISFFRFRRRRRNNISIKLYLGKNRSSYPIWFYLYANILLLILSGRVHCQVTTKLVEIQSWEIKQDGGAQIHAKCMVMVNQPFTTDKNVFLAKKEKKRVVVLLCLTTNCAVKQKRKD